MLRCATILLVLTCASFAQTTPPATTPAKPATPAPAQPARRPGNPESLSTPDNVPPDAAVITINGACAAGANGAKPADCKTTVTRAEFEKTQNALSPKMAPQTKRQLAQAWAQMLVLDHAAQEMGIDKDPRTQEVLRFAHMRALAEQLVKIMNEKYATSTAEEIQKYYDDHKANYEQATLRRILIPTPTAGDKPLDEAAAKAAAEKYRTRAMAGEDLVALEKEAFKAAGVTSEPPEVTPLPVRKESIPAENQNVFDLKPGEFSELIAGQNGFVLVKMDSKTTATLSSVKDEVQKKLQDEKLEKAMKDLMGAAPTTFNTAYFGTGEPRPAGATAPNPGSKDRAETAPARPRKEAQPQ